MDQFQKQLLIIGTPISLVVGAAYLWGFWSTFNINIFEYARLQDAALIAVIPLASLIVGIAIGTAQGMVETKLEPTAKNLRAAKLDQKVSKITMLIFIWAPITVSVIGINQSSWRWYVGWTIILLPLVIFSNYIFKELWSTKRGTFIFAGFFVLLAAFCIGKGNAYSIVEVWEYFTSEVDGTSLKHLGHLNESHFYIDQSNEILTIISGDAAEKITLKRVHRAFIIKDELFK